MCNKYANHHNGFLENYLYNIDKDLEDIFTTFCREENHNMKLEYSYNKLCYGAFLYKIKDEISWSSNAFSLLPNSS